MTVKWHPFIWNPKTSRHGHIVAHPCQNFFTVIWNMLYLTILLTHQKFQMWLLLVLILNWAKHLSSLMVQEFLSLHLWLFYIAELQSKRLKIFLKLHWPPDLKHLFTMSTYSQENILHFIWWGFKTGTDKRLSSFKDLSFNFNVI